MKIFFLAFILIIPITVNAKQCLPHDACIVSFYELLPNPQKFQNVTIGIVGFVKKVENEWFLFPTNNARQYGLFEQAIFFDYVNAEIKSDLDEGDVVYVYGRFSTEYTGKQEYVKGAIISEVKLAKLE